MGGSPRSLGDVTLEVRDGRGRMYVATLDSTLGGEKFTAGDCRAWIEHGWPERYSRTEAVTPEVGRRRHGTWRHRWFGMGPHPEYCVHSTVRSFSGEPLPGDPAECECACGCGWHGSWGEVDPAGGVMRCAGCVASGHPPVDRWSARSERRESGRG